LMVLQVDKKKAVIYTFDPPKGTFSQLSVKTDKALPNIAQTFAIPVEGIMWKKTIGNNKTFPLEFSSLSLYSQTNQNDITLIDAVRLWWFSQSARKSSIQSASVTLPDDVGKLDTATEDFFIDSQLETDKKSITIINGTSVSGLGSRLEKMLTHIGGSVISVTTAHTPITKSKIIYYGQTNYSVERLKRIFPFEIEHREGDSLSDILIEVGEDSQRMNLF
jgi:hypothetical protein